MQNVEVIHRHTHMQEKKLVDREQEVIFTNWTDRDFEHTWNKRLYRFKANKSYYLPFYLAEHFAKHLVDRELNNRSAAEVAKIRAADPRIDSKEIQRVEQSILGNLQSRHELMDKCVEIPSEANVGFVSPKEVPMREVKLKTTERTEHYVKDGRLAPGDGAMRRPVTDGATPATGDASGFVSA